MTSWKAALLLPLVNCGAVHCLHPSVPSAAASASNSFALGRVGQGVPIRQHARARSIVCIARTFPELGIRSEICDALETLGVNSPNPLQVQAIPALSGGADVVLGAQTGSGKTLTYLIPVMQRLKADEDFSGVRSKPRRPRAIVLVPTRELALQVHEVGRSICRQVRLSVSVIHGGVPEGPQRKIFDKPVDLLVATPGRLLQLLQKGAVYLGDVRQVVIDEVDTMFEAGFGDELDRILRITTRDLSADPRAAAAETLEERVQHIAVGATHPKAAMALYQKRLGGAKQVMVSGMHSVPRTLQQRFITCKGPDAKVTELRTLLGDPDESGSPSLGRVVLFCNSQNSARFVDHTLVEHGYATANYHGAVPANMRADNFKRFREGEAAVLVTTDVAARGLDNLDVAHVVQFDFPKNAADYLHRCGRTARAGKSGTVYSLVTKHDTELVRAIRGAHSAGEDIVQAAERAVPSPGVLRVRRQRRDAQVAFPGCEGVGKGGADGERSATSKPDAAAESTAGRRGQLKAKLKSPAGKRGTESAQRGRGRSFRP